MRGLYSRKTRIQENIFEESFAAYEPNFWEKLFRGVYMSHLYSHPREYRKIFLGNYLCIGFVPGGNPAVVNLMARCTMAKQCFFDGQKSTLDSYSITCRPAAANPHSLLFWHCLRDGESRCKSLHANFGMSLAQRTTMGKYKKIF